MPLYLAGTMRLPGHLSAAFHSGRFLIIVLALGLAFICVLAVPVFTDRFLSFASAQGAKIARSTFLLGLGILLFGLVIRVEVVDFVGAGLMGAVILGIILENYLAAGWT